MAMFTRGNTATFEPSTCGPNGVDVSEQENEGTRAGAAEIQAVDRAAQILSIFGPDRPKITAVEAAELLDLNRTTTYRYCTSLVSVGLLERGPEAGTFVPGALLMQLGAFAIGRRRVIDLAPTFMRDLRATTGLTVVLSLWGAMGPIVSHVEEEVNRSIVVTVRVGTQLPLQAAQSKVFLAHLGDQLRVDRLIATLPDRQREHLRDEIDGLSGAGGLAVGDDSYGIHAMAAPVFDEYSICASLALIGTNDMLPLDVTSHVARSLRESAQALSEAMGAAPAAS